LHFKKEDGILPNRVTVLFASNSRLERFSGTRNPVFVPHKSGWKVRRTVSLILDYPQKAVQ